MQPSVVKMFRISWEGYPGNPKPEQHNQDYFSEEIGFSSYDILAIDQLSIGESYTTGGPADSVTVMRLQ